MIEIYYYLKYGINGKIYSAVKTIYRFTVAKVCINNLYTDTFDTSVGVGQGDPVSPILFNLYVNDLLNELDSIQNVVTTT